MEKSKKHSRANRRIFAILVTCIVMLGLMSAITSAAYIVGTPESYTTTTTVTIDQSGWYYVEAWGGNGGASAQGSRSVSGGTSQLESGYFHFSAGDILYIQVGTAGGNGSGASGVTGGSAGTGGVGDYFGSGYDGGNGGDGYAGRYVQGIGGGGGGGGGAASGILLNGQDVDDIIIASGGGGGAGGYSQLLLKQGGAGGNSGQEGGVSAVTSNNGALWSGDLTEGYYGGFIRHDGETAASVTTLSGGGGAGGGGGGWNGSFGGGGQSGNGGKASIDSEAGGGGAGGQSANAGQTIPGSIALPSANSRTTGADGQVYVTLVAETYTVTYSAADATSGTIPTDSVVYLEDEVVTVLGDDSLIRNGYTFKGWSDGTNVYQPGDVFNITGDTTLTAVWKAKSTPKASDIAKTGDISNTWVWMAIGLASALCMAAVIMKVKRSKKESA